MTRPNLLIFPDTTVIAHQVLNTALPAYPTAAGTTVGSRLPSPIPDRFIRCYTLPGREICARTMSCQVIAQTYDINDVQGGDLARLITAILRAAPNTDGPHQPWVSGPCETHGPYPYQDPEVPTRFRHQSTVTWTVASHLVD